MSRHDQAPREGGVKVVFDVAESDADVVGARVAAAGFAVHRYYRLGEERGRGRSAPGSVRFGAERAMKAFTAAEQEVIVADFDAVQHEAGFACVRIGTDVWTAGGDDPAGDREPRVPMPRSGLGATAMVPER